MDKLTSEFDELVKITDEKIITLLPYLEKDVHKLISEKSTNEAMIDGCFALLLFGTHHKLGKDLYIKLLEYYKTVDEEDAMFYWEEYDKFQNSEIDEMGHKPIR